MAMFLGLTHFQLSKSKGKHCAVVFFCGSASVVRPRPPPKTSERPVSLRPAVARSTIATDRDRAPPHMSPDDDSCSLIIGNDHLQGRKIKVVKSGDLDSGFRESEVKKKKGKILDSDVKYLGQDCNTSLPSWDVRTKTLALHVSLFQAGLLHCDSDGKSTQPGWRREG